MMATTATRNATDTMIPRSVKNERSLWLHAARSASSAASENGMRENLTGGRTEGRKDFDSAPLELWLESRKDVHVPRESRHEQAQQDCGEDGGNNVSDRRERGPVARGNLPVQGQRRVQHDHDDPGLGGADAAVAQLER